MMFHASVRPYAKFIICKMFAGLGWTPLWQQVGCYSMESLFRNG
jgi:hypothetical protein